VTGEWWGAKGEPFLERIVCSDPPASEEKSKSYAGKGGGGGGKRIFKSFFWEGSPNRPITLENKEENLTLG